MVIAECPNCNAHIEIEPIPVIGLPVECYCCNVKLEVTWLYPVALDFPERKVVQEQEVEIKNKI
jgi:hypothetical protein